MICTFLETIYSRLDLRCQDVNESDADIAGLP